MPQTMTPAPSPAEADKKRRTGPLLAMLALATIVLGTGVAWWLGLLTPEPEAVSLDATVESVQAAAEQSDDAQSTETQGTDTQTTDAQAADSAAADSGAASDGVATPASIGLDGTWTVVSGDSTFVGYRADSQVGEAVGRSPGVAGSLEATDEQIVAVTITADMTQLTSDSSLRDEHLGDEGIEYNTYPTSTFVLTNPIDIGAVPEEGVTLSFDAVGDLTIRDISRPVTISLEGAQVDGDLVIVGSAELSLDDFGASVSSTDQATMEFSLVFSKA